MPGPARSTHLILYVADAARSKAFWREVLGRAPRLDVHGMTEFDLPGGAVLGLMPESGIKRLLGDALPDPSRARGIPRAEVYLPVADPARALARDPRARGASSASTGRASSSRRRGASVVWGRTRSSSPR